ncbi:MAG: hypothetical protein WCG82_11255 [Bacteroidota bacterium]
MKKFLIILILMSLYPSIILAKTYEVETTGEYVMGDRDTKADARRIALEHAKLLAVEQIGTYLESETVVQNSQVTKDEIRTYASAIVKTIVLSEDVRLLENKTTMFSLNIKANVDISVLEKKIKEIKADVKRSKQIASLQSENIRLLKELENLSTMLKSETAGQYKNLRQERENVLEKLEKNQNSIRIAFEKGTLLNLALKNRDELGESKRNIDEALQFIADNTVFTLGEPQIRNKGNKSDLVINVEWSIQNINELLRKLALFYENPTVDSINYIKFNSLYFKGINYEELYDYFKSKTVRIYVQAGSRKVFNYIKVNLSDHPYIIKAGTASLTISDIPTVQLSQITGIEAKVIVESKSSRTRGEDKIPLKKSRKKKR